jgi:uncharacterized protein with HEPN domain
VYDEDFLLDMLLAARHAAEYVKGLSWAEFSQDRSRQDAVTYRVQVIGEAASNVSLEFRAAHPEIPWQRIVGMRHRIVHDYRELRRDLLWSVARDDAPELITQLEPLVPPEEPD